MAERFSRLKFPVHKISEAEGFDKQLPELFRLPEFKKLKLLPNWWKIVRYIVYLYDKNTDLAQEFPNDLKARKEAAALESGYTREGGSNKWPEVLEEIMGMKHKDVYTAIVAYMRLQDSPLLSDIHATEQEFYDFQERRLRPIEDDDDLKQRDLLMEMCKKRRVAIDSMKSEFYGDHRDVQNAEFSEMITPEKAERILDSMDPPYKEIRPEMEGQTHVLAD